MIRAVVIAGTPVDTKMGVDYLERRSAEYCTPVCKPIYRTEVTGYDLMSRSHIIY